MKEAQQAVDVTINATNKLYDFAFTPAGMFLLQVLGVLVLSELVIKTLVDRITVFTTFSPKKEKALSEIIAIISTPILSIISAVVFYDGIQAIFGYSAALVTMSMLIHIYWLKRYKDEKDKKYGGK